MMPKERRPDDAASGTVRCGSCDEAFGYDWLYESFSAGDYRAQFEIECSCGSTLEIDVTSIPEFTIYRTRPKIAGKT